MCTYVTENVPVSGSAKGPEGWFSLSRATVYFDHPFHAPLEHSLNIDFADPTDPAAAAASIGSMASVASVASTRRVAVELSAASARALARAILATLDIGEASVGGAAAPS
jgi:hypothetical protein